MYTDALQSLLPKNQGMAGCLGTKVLLPRHNVNTGQVRLTYKLLRHQKLPEGM